MQIIMDGVVHMDELMDIGHAIRSTSKCYLGWCRSYMVHRRHAWTMLVNHTTAVGSLLLLHVSAGRSRVFAVIHSILSVIGSIPDR